MVIDLKKCADRPLEVQDSFDLTGRFASYPEIETIDPVAADLKVAPAGSGRYLISGSFVTRVSAYCVRCLEPTPFDLSGRIRLTLLPEEQRPDTSLGEHQMDSGEVELSYYEGDRLEVLPVLEEQVNLGFPMRFLCKEECRGLCQYCGANKNLTDCGCVEPRFDPKPDALKGLRH